MAGATGATLRPLLLKLGSVAAYTTMTALFKLAGDVAPPGQVVFFRCFFALVPLLLWLALAGRLKEAVTIGNPLGHLRRSGFGALSMACFFAALPMVPLFDATILFFASPLSMIWLSALILKEPPTRAQALASVIGFSGVLIAMGPQLMERLAGGAATSLTGTLLVLVSALLTALAMISLREISRTETPASIIFVFLSGVSVLAALLTGYGWVWPGWTAIGWLVLGGIFGGIGQILMTYAYKLGAIGLISVIEYTGIIFAAGFGYLLFSAVPGWFAVAGAVLVTLAGLLVALTNPRSEPADPP